MKDRTEYLWLRVLRVVVALQCVGQAWLAYTSGTKIETYLFMNVGLDPAMTRMLDVGFAVALIAGGLAVLRAARPWIPWAIAGFFFAQAAAGTLAGGGYFPEFKVFAHAVRWGAPLVLGVWLAASFEGTGDREIATSDLETRASWVLRAMAAATFVAHGYEALQLHPRFLDYLIVFFDRVLSVGAHEGQMSGLLYAVGIIDLLVAALVLVPWKKRGILRAILLYMAVWGVVTAASRVIFGDLSGVPMMLVRAANGGVPLVLFYLFARDAEPSGADASQG